jgi:glycosyltransferase involved in cell wall biosynthesis
MPKIALIHDWLTGMRGGEKVLEVLCEIFPAADVFTLVYAKGSVSPAIERHRIHTSPLQLLPGAPRYYRRLLPFMPWAIERFDFRGYDLLISTSHCVAKGAIPPIGAKHYCYCHTPMRYVWDQYDQYFAPGRSGRFTRALMKMLRPYLQQWDVHSSSRVNVFFANSANVAERIRRIYKRAAEVLYPPVDYEFYSQEDDGKDLPPEIVEATSKPYHLIVSALAPYKRVELAIEAFLKLRRPLLIIGDGQEMASLRRYEGPFIRFLGWQEKEALRRCYAKCQALLFPGEEDFGIVPLEAMSAGRPVIALRKGGALETVRDGETGLFFDQPTGESLTDAVARCEKISWDGAAIQKHAKRFERSRCEESFRRAFAAYGGEMSPRR